jgi:hypothetical protein
MPVSSMESKGIDEAWNSMNNYKDTMMVFFFTILLKPGVSNLTDENEVEKWRVD